MMQQLVSLALIGTANAAQDPASDAAFDLLYPLIPEGGREQRLLWLAGSAAVYARAGALAAAASRPAVAQDDSLPRAPAGTTPLLKSAIDGELDALAAWMVQRLQQAGVRLPDALLPAALGQRDSKDAAQWLPVLGERGRWLAQQNPAWRKLLDKAAAAAAADEADLRQTWEEGNTAQRRAALLAQRQRDPAVARGWVAATLPKEKADLRQQWVEALETGLNHDDADLLERQLDDRSQGVRAAAAALLARLPASACATRLRDRALACMQWQTGAKPSGLGKLAAMVGMGGALQLQVEPPAELAKDWERDGIVANPPAGEGKRAFWLRQLLGLIDPRLWSDTAASSAAELLPAIQKNEWAEALLHGLAAATRRFGNADWAAALLALQASAPLKYLEQYEAGLWQTLPDTKRHATIKTRLAAGDLQGALDGLRHSSAPWPEDLSVQTVALLTRVKPANTVHDVFQGHIQALEQCLIQGADTTLPALAAPVRDCQAAAAQFQDWSASMRTRLADRLATLYQAKLQFIKEMPL
jgi:hypothetical protein